MSSSSPSKSGSSSGVRRKPAINRNTPVMSYAYGAAGDGKGNSKRPPVSMSGSEAGANGAAAASATPEPAPAKERYAALKARNRNPQPRTNPSILLASAGARRSPRLSSQYGGSQSAHSLVSGQRDGPDPADLEVDEGLESDEAGIDEAKEQAAPRPSASVSSATTTTHRPRGGPVGMKSFFVRARASRSPGGDSDDAPAGSAHIHNSLLLGAQRPSNDVLSPGMTSLRSDEGAEEGGYDYAAEDSFANARRARSSNHSSSWFGSLLGRAQGAQTLSSGSGLLEADEDAAAAAADTSTGSASIRRKHRRISDDNRPFRPNPEDDDDDDEDSADGRKHGRKGRSASGPQARAGRDDNKVWGTKKRKGKAKGKGKGKAGEAEEEEEDSEDGQEPDDTLDASHTNGIIDGEQSSRRAHPRRRTSATDKLSWCSPTTAGWVVGSILVLMLAGLATTPEAAHLAQSLLPRRGGAFTAPLLPPSTAADVVSRMQAIEATLAGLSADSTEFRRLSTDATRMRKELEKRVGKLEAGGEEMRTVVEALRKRADEAKSEGERRSGKLEKEQGALLKRIEALAHQLAEAESKAVHAAKTAGGDGASAARDDKRITALTAELERAKARLDTVAAQALSANQAASSTRDALAALEKRLPDFMPVRLDRKGSVHIEPAFWTELRKVFAPKGAAGKSASGATDGDWDAFRSANEASIRALAREEGDRAVTGALEGGTLLSRSAYLDLVTAEIEQAKRLLETRFNENVQGLQDDLLGKVRAQNEAYMRAGSWKAGAGAGATSKTAAGSAEDATLSASYAEALARLAGLKTADGAEASSAFAALIDAALERYSADRLGRPDYALFSAGARVLGALTSPSLGMDLKDDRWALSRWVGLGQHTASAPQGRPPVNALHPDTAPGMCWAFTGHEGQLGLLLARRIVATDVTVEHASRALALDQLSGGDGDDAATPSDSAPREVHVWAMLDREEDKEKARKLQRERVEKTLARAKRVREGQAADEAEDTTQPTPSPPVLFSGDTGTSPEFLHLGTVQYDARSSRAVQTFPLDAEVRALGIATRYLIFRVASNWGNPRHTCLYRVRAHGNVVREEGM